jgi:TonB family protein
VEVPPVLIKRVEPKYPPLALRSGAAGTVTVNALISETGDVLRTEILKGIKDGFGLEDAALAAIQQWKFRPARKDKVDVRVWKSFDITFKQNQKKS